MRLPDINPAQGSLQQSQVIRQPNILEGMGESLGVFGEMKARKEERDAREAVVEKSTDLHLGSIRALQEASLEAENPSQIGELFVKKYQTLTDNLGSGISSGRGKELFNEQAGRYREMFGAKALDLEFSQTMEKRKNTLDRANNSYISNIRNGDEIDLNIQGGETVWSQYREGDLINDNAYTEGSYAFKNSAVKARMDYLIENTKFQEAEDFLVNGDYKTNFTSDDVDVYREKIATAKTKLKGAFLDDFVDAYDTVNGKPESPAAYVAAQELRGVDPTLAKVLSKDEVKSISQQLNGIGSASQFNLFLQGAREKFGDYTPNAIRQIVDDKDVGDELSYAMQMHPVVDAKAIELIFEFKNKPIADLTKEMKARLPGNESFDLTLNKRIKEDIDIISKNTGADPIFLREQTKRLAYSHVAKYGSTEDEAINYAASTLRGGNTYVDFGNSKFLVSEYKYKPNEIQYIQDSIEDYTKQVGENIDIMTENKIVADIVSKGLVRNKDIEWVSNNDGSGLFLQTSTGIMLIDKEGKPIEAKFKDLIKMGEDKDVYIANYYEVPYGEREAKRIGRLNLPNKEQVIRKNKALVEKMNKPIGAE